MKFIVQPASLWKLSVLRCRTVRLQRLVPVLPGGPYLSTFEPLRTPPLYRWCPSSRLPPRHSISVIFDQSCRRSQGRWWTDASPSQRSRRLCSVRSSTKKLTGCYWFPLFGDSLYTWQPKWGHSPAFWHISRVCILKLHPAQRSPQKRANEDCW